MLSLRKVYKEDQQDLEFDDDTDDGDNDEGEGEEKEEKGEKEEEKKEESIFIPYWFIASFHQSLRSHVKVVLQLK